MSACPLPRSVSLVRALISEELSSSTVAATRLVSPRSTQQPTSGVLSHIQHPRPHQVHFQVSITTKLLLMANNSQIHGLLETATIVEDAGDARSLPK